MKEEKKIYIDSIDNKGIEGWFINQKNPEKNKVLLYLDGQYKAVTIANIQRQDVADAHGKLESGFYFDIKKFPNFHKLEIYSESKDKLLSLDNIKQEMSLPEEGSSLDLIPPYSRQRHELLESITIELNRPINGINWYAIEPSGRWAGPELESVLTIPALPKGKYELHLDIASTFCDLETMEVLFNDKPVKFLKTKYHAPVILKAKISVEKDQACWEIIFKFPETCPPDGESGADQRRLGIFLKSVILTRISSSKSKH